MTGLLAASLDYTDKDFDSIKLRLQSLIRSAFPKWTDFNVANFGNILLELFGFTIDVIGLYQDNQALEAFIAKATQRKNMIALAKLLNYQVPSAAAAHVDVTFTLKSVPTSDVILPKGSTARTAQVTNALVFQLLGDVTIIAGQNPPTATGTVENSTSATEIFAVTGLPNQEVPLGTTPYIDDSAEVAAGNGTYSQVTDFLSSTSTDRHFTIVVDQNDRATVRFGNGVNGALPFGSITVDYKVGGGLSGNVEPGSITKLDGRFTDILGAPVEVIITNPERAVDGADRASVEQIRIEAPRSVRVQNRTVAREDYEINALRVPGVARALMTTSNEDPGVAENAGILYIVPSSGGNPSQTLKDAVFTMCTVTYPKTITFTLEVAQPLYLPLNIEATCYRRSGTTPAQMGAAVRSALASFLSILAADGTPNELINFGFAYKSGSGFPDGVIPLDQLFNVIRDLPQIRRMGDDASEFIVNGIHKDIAVLARQFPQIGTVTIIDGDTGLLV